MVGNKAVRHLQYSLVPTRQAQQMRCHFWSRHCLPGMAGNALCHITFLASVYISQRSVSSACCDFSTVSV